MGIAYIAWGVSKARSESIFLLEFLISINIDSHKNAHRIKSGSYSDSDYSPKFSQSLGNRAGEISLEQVSCIGRRLIKPSLDFIHGLLKMCNPLGAFFIELRLSLI